MLSKIQKNTMDFTTLPSGEIQGLKFPTTTVRPPHYRNKSVETLIHSVDHNYQLDLTEAINFHRQDEQTNNAFEVTHIDLYKGPMIHNIVYNLVPYQKIAHRTLPPLAYCHESSGF